MTIYQWEKLDTPKEPPEMMRIRWNRLKKYIRGCKKPRGWKKKRRLQSQIYTDAVAANIIRVKERTETIHMKVTIKP